MDVLAGKTLMRKNGEMVPAEEALSNVEVIGFYFSAHWCPPCRFFTPVLAEFHAALKEANEPFEIVFISSDETKEEMTSYINESHGDWLAVPFGEDILSKGDRSPDSHKAIKKNYYVSGIPTLIIVKPDGERITNNGRGDIDEVGNAAWRYWKDGKGIVPPDSEEEEEEEEGNEEKEEEKEAAEEKEDKEAAEEKEDKEAVEEKEEKAGEAEQES